MDTRTPAQRSRPSLLHRVILTVVGLGLVVGALAAFATVVLAGPRDGFSNGAPSVRLIDERGDIVDGSSHVLDVAGAYPGMPAQRSELRLRNSGSVPAAFDLAAIEVRTAGGANLDRVLLLTVRDSDSGRTVYRGRLSNLEISGGAAVQSGSSASYQVSVTWPDHGGDANQYQGATIGFTVEATAHEAS